MGWLWNTAAAETSTHLHSFLLPYTAIEILAEHMASPNKDYISQAPLHQGVAIFWPYSNGMPDVSFLKTVLRDSLCPFYFLSTSFPCRAPWNLDAALNHKDEDQFQGIVNQ